MLRLVYIAIIFYYCTISTVGIYVLDLDQILADSPVGSYSKYLDKLYYHDEELLKNYPKKNKLTNLYPPPMGSEFKWKQLAGADGRARVDEVWIWQLETQVKIWTEVLRVNTVDVEKQSLAVLVSQTLRWADFSLNNTMDLPGEPGEAYLYSVSIHADKIWTPQIYSVNVFKSEVVYDPEEVLCNLAGYCLQQKVIEYTIPCSLQLQVFPFDGQTCILTLSQPIDQSTRMNITVEKYGKQQMEFTGEFDNVEWKLESTKPSVECKEKGMKGKQCATYKLMIALRRKGLFYGIVLIFPCVLLNMISLVIFTLRIDATDRLSFTLTLILTYFVLLTLIVQLSPPTGTQMPLLGMYMLGSLIILSVSFAMSLVLIEIHEHRRSMHRKMPHCLSKVLDKISCLLWVCFCTRERHFISGKAFKEYIPKDVETFTMSLMEGYENSVKKRWNAAAPNINIENNPNVQTEQLPLHDMKATDNENELPSTVDERKDVNIEKDCGQFFRKPKNGKVTTGKYSLEMTNDDYKWKILCKFVNILFFWLTCLAHILLVMLLSLLAYHG